MDQMGMGGVMGQQQPPVVGPVGGGAPGPPGPPGNTGFPQNMPPLNPTAPGSPARAFPGMASQPNSGNPGFNPLPSLNSQFQSEFCVCGVSVTFCLVLDCCCMSGWTGIEGYALPPLSPSLLQIFLSCCSSIQPYSPA